MKLKKIIIVISLFILAGCSFENDFSDKYLYTTTYPLEYAASMLYKDSVKVASVYPNSADENYKITSKKKEKYSKGEIFVYSGISNEAEIAKDLLNLNSDIKIIDATKGMNIKYDSEEIWIDPSNYLMLCSNIKRSLTEYNYNLSDKETIEENYKHLNELISEIDVNLYDIGKNGNYDTILVTNDIFNYLTKYNINVISIDKDNENIDLSYAEAKKLINNKKIQYIYSLDSEVLTEAQEKYISDNALVKISINNIRTLTDEERNNGENYITLMNQTIMELKRELYKN